jgi:hypothetical protein
MEISFQNPKGGYSHKNHSHKNSIKRIYPKRRRTKGAETGAVGLRQKEIDMDPSLNSRVVHLCIMYDISLRWGK